MPLVNGLGAHRYAITTRSPLAQRYFEQGLRLGWASEQAAAARSFAEAERLDPRCAMCAWGAAWMLGASPPPVTWVGETSRSRPQRVRR